jgi:hypothetical protein
MHIYIYIYKYEDLHKIKPACCVYACRCVTCDQHAFMIYEAFVLTPTCKIVEGSLKTFNSIWPYIYIYIHIIHTHTHVFTHPLRVQERASVCICVCMYVYMYVSEPFAQSKNTHTYWHISKRTFWKWLWTFCDSFMSASCVCTYSKYVHVFTYLCVYSYLYDHTP